MARIALVVAPETFRDEELFETQAELEAAHHDIVIVSKQVGECTGRFGGTTYATLAAADVVTADYDAIVFIGGGGCKIFFDEPDANRIARDMIEHGKTLAAICLAPMILARAGLLDGKRVSITESEKDNVIDYGAEYVGPGVVVDGQLITADGPEVAAEFGKIIVSMFPH